MAAQPAGVAFDHAMPSARSRRLPVRTGTGEPPFELIESKLHPETPRRGMVVRASLVRELLAVEAPVTTVIAPPGYGKTTLLAQWAAAQGQRLVWLSVDDSDNDARVLLTYLAAGLDRVEPIGPGVFEAIGSHRPLLTILTRLLNALDGMRQPVAIAIDQAECLTDAVFLDTLGEIAIRLPPTARLVLASRETLPTARLRVQRRLTELGVNDLALDLDEAMALLEAVDVRLAADEVTDLIGRTEGWPAGLYLAALAIRAGVPPADALERLSGSDRYLGDYLRSELLDRIAPDEVEFLTRTSILDRLSGPLCDATLGTTGSAQRLQHIEDRNLLLVPLDGHREWYRYHQLLREFLVSELERREPELVPALHARAAAWSEADGQPERALRHAQAANDVAHAARLISTLAQPTWASGRAETVMGWLEWLESEGDLPSYPELVVHGSLMYALLGHPIHAERWAEAAESAGVAGVTADGSTMEGLLAYLRALLARDGLSAMRADAILGYQLLSPSSPYRATMLFTEGVSYLLDDDRERADAILAHAFDAALAAGAEPLAALVLAERCAIAAGRDDWSEAAALDAQALELVGGGTFDEYWTSALVFAWAARLAAHASDVEGARAHIATALRLRPLLTYALPVVSIQTLLEMARVYVVLADPTGARTVLRQAHDILQQRPDLGGLGTQVEQLRERLDATADGPTGASSLSAAELRAVPLLATHLTLKEIGERLYVSRSTVKSQSISIYRKLGVSSRSEAVERLQELGLLVL